MSELRNLNLEISKYAMKCVDTAIHNNEKVEQKKQYIAKYKTLVKKMPSYLQKNGLIATFAFVFSKGKKEHFEIIENMIMWNKQNDKINDFNREKLDFRNFQYNGKKNDIEKYIQWMYDLKSNEYRQVTKEMMLLFGWMKRFVDAMIDTKEDTQEDNAKKEGESKDGKE